ncbi:MAG: ATP synthase F1 subunit gamma [Labilithrix sp.]|nr:ATP synthase F1 subunit gamma [Labilithrix sp.]MCW5817696.1 ATP synthase F1 subunit gamma [Labilithrix sp.]
MASLKTIRKRITSVKATQKITRAMKMVAGARLNRAQMRITALRPYALKVQEVLNDVSAAMIEKVTDSEHGSGEAETLHPLLERRAEKKVLFLVMSGDRGLSGAFNGNVNKAAERNWKKKQEEGVDVRFATVGRKAREFLTRRRGNVVKDFPRFLDGLDMSKAKIIADYVVKTFQSGEIDAVYLVYNEFKSAMTQRTTMEQLLPPPPPSEVSKPKDGVAPTIGFEPNEHIVLERLVPMYVEISIYRALLETQAGFFGAQMTAMDSATRNAKDMIARLSLQYNRARQAAITKELMEIIGGAEALKD